MRRLRTAGGDFHIKSYDYATWGSRWQGFCRTTGPWVRSRATREFDALTWLAEHAPPAADAIAVFEHRRAGLLCRAVLVTATFAGDPLDRLLAATDDRAGLAHALGCYVARLHGLGYRDGNLDLRNLIGRRDDGGEWVISKIDSPKYRLRRPGEAPDRWTAADWQRLLPQLAPFGLAEETRAAARGQKPG